MMTTPEQRRLPPPRDLRATPRVRVAEMCDELGEAESAGVCAALLSGVPPDLYAVELSYLGGLGAQALLDGGWAPYWAQVWGGRGLLYLWDPTAGSSVVAGLSDPHWRVAEMCLKVSALHELAEAGDPASQLLRHELPRVRSNAVRTLGLVGDTEHVNAVVGALEDDDPQVRRAAELALQRLTARLDLIDPGSSPRE